VSLQPGTGPLGLPRRTGARRAAVAGAAPVEEPESAEPGPGQPR